MSAVETIPAPPSTLEEAITEAARSGSIDAVSVAQAIERVHMRRIAGEIRNALSPVAELLEIGARSGEVDDELFSDARAGYRLALEWLAKLERRGEK